jgi:dipeptidase
MPFYAGVTAIPESFQIGDHWIFNRNSARWAFDYVDFHTLVAYSLAIEDVKKAREKWEDGAIAQIPTIDKLAADLYKKDPAKTSQFLTDFCINNANLVVDAWWKLGDDLLVKYNHLWLYDVQKRTRDRIEFPDWWLKELVDYDKLVPQPKQKKRPASKSGQNISEKMDRP